MNGSALKAELEAVRGKPLLINVWATWCKPCIEEMPEFVELYEARDDLGIAFLSLSADMVRDMDSAVRPFAKDHALPFPVYVLDGLPPEETAAILGVTGTGWDGALPATFILDANGALVKDWQESVTKAEIEAAL
jgi:thiol-disulfide isomerase/thioredoxin